MPNTIDVVGPRTVLEWAERSVASLDASRDALDRANVFPVADSDTGTNMHLTMREGLRELRRADPDETASARGALTALARGALLGARGNSGIILGEYLRGMATSATDAEHDGCLDGALLATAFGRAASLATAAVASPVHGTILTAARAAAEGAARLGGGRLSDVVDAACRAAGEAAGRSGEELPALRGTGLLDAGAQGLVVVLTALLDAVGGEAPRVPFPTGGRPAPSVAVSEACGTMPGMEPPVDPHADHDEFEVMFGLSTDDPNVAARLRPILEDVGTSVVVVGGTGAGEETGTWYVHLHTADVVATIRSARVVATGRRAVLHDVRVRHLGGSGGRDGRPAVGIVASTAAPGVASELARAGVVVLLGTDPAGVDAEGLVRSPDTAALRRAAAETGAQHVVVLSGLPGPVDAVSGTSAGWAADGIESLTVLPCGSDTQILAAVATFAVEGSATGAAKVVAMLGEVVGDVRVGRITCFDRLDEELGEALDSALADDGESLMILVDDEVDDETVACLVARGRERLPHLETVVLRTGRPGQHIELGAMG